jgi:hypothetical protein
MVFKSSLDYFSDMRYNVLPCTCRHVLSLNSSLVKRVLVNVKVCLLTTFQECPSEWLYKI